MIILSCGHPKKRVEWAIEYWDQEIDYENGFVPVKVYSVVCPKCYQWWKRQKCFIKGERVL